MAHLTAQQMQGRGLRRGPVAALKTAWHFTRFLLGRRRPDRFRLFWDYQKIQFWRLIQPKRTKPLKLLGFHVHYPSLYLLRHLFNEVVLEPTYKFSFPTNEPLIIDAGANIGLTMLFYLYQYPGARIVCFEPEPRSFAILKQQIETNNLTNVTAHNVALSDQRGTLTLYHDPGLEGDTTASISKEFHAHAGGDADLEAEQVPAAPLSEFLTEPVDLLKIDIEGSEGIVLAEIEPKLGRVKQIQMEYHYDQKSNPLEKLIALLERSGHAYEIVAPAGLRNEPGSVAIIYTHLRERQRAAK
jgi:FkbM family methyltransferase